MVKNITKPYSRHAFTLVEIMIVCICISILVGPIYMLLRSGSDSSMKGMTRIETTLKARRVLQQVYADLKMICFINNREHLQKVKFSNAMTIVSQAPNFKCWFYSFPTHEQYDQMFETAQNSSGTLDLNSKVCKITYTVEGGNNSVFKTLKRKVEFGDKSSETVLSDKVSSFFIDPIAVKVEDKLENYYQINLTLVDVVHENLKDSITAEQINYGSKEIIKAEFFDVVYPEYVHSYIDDDAINPGWHHQIYPPGNSEN